MLLLEGSLMCETLKRCVGNLSQVYERLKRFFGKISQKCERQSLLIMIDDKKYTYF